MAITFSPLIDQLIAQLRCLPGVGPKSAQRMAFQLLARNRDQGLQLAEILKQTLSNIKHCARCRTFCEETICRFCSDERRDTSLLCVVENPSDILAVEQTATFHGYYFVLMGHLSPLDGIGPDAIGIPMLLQQIEQRPIQEIILATNPTVEGEATAHYIAELVKTAGIKTSRIAHGVPLGGELELVDSGTLARAFVARSVFETQE